MQKKIDTLRAMMKANDWESAIKFAAKFPRLGESKTAITRAKDCLNNPKFYIQMGFDVNQAIKAGKSALISRYIANK